MPVLDVLSLPLSSLFAEWSAPLSVLAYGPGPPIDLIPYFLGLAAWVGFAFLAIVLSPLTALLRFLRRKKSITQPANTNESETQSIDEQPPSS